MNSQRGMAALTALVFLGMTGQALALDAYKDRRGFLVRIGVGATSNEACTSNCRDRHLGLALRLRAGVGLNQNLTVDFGIHHTTSNGDAIQLITKDADRTVMGLFIGTNYYTQSGLYGRFSLGLTQFDEVPTLPPEQKALEPIVGLADISETGLAYGFELGFELFANSDWAAGISADLEMHQYDDGLHAQLLTFGITGTYY